jgi:hypothetical protein
MKLITWDELSEPDYSKEEDGLIIALSRDELATLGNGLGQAIEYVDDWEYDTLVGGTRQESRSIRRTITDILAATRIPE